MTIVLLALVALLAFANGSNDNSKGVATLVGFGAARPRQALAYATVATALGGIVSFHLAGGLLKGFSGSWLFSSGVSLDTRFYVAVLIGACGWMLVANKTGMPVSTTHAIIGALCGAGLVSFGNAKFQWAMLGRRFAVPLALSPVLSLAVVYCVAWPVLFVVKWYAGRCVCVVNESMAEPALFTSTSGGLQTITAGGIGVKLVTGTEVECDSEHTLAVATTSEAVTGVHWVSCGLISFARLERHAEDRGLKHLGPVWTRAWNCHRLCPRDDSHGLRRIVHGRQGSQHPGEETHAAATGRIAHGKSHDRHPRWLGIVDGVAGFDHPRCDRSHHRGGIKKRSGTGQMVQGRRDCPVLDYYPAGGGVDRRGRQTRFALNDASPSGLSVVFLRRFICRFCESTILVVRHKSTEAIKETHSCRARSRQNPGKCHA